MLHTYLVTLLAWLNQTPLPKEYHNILTDEVAKKDFIRRPRAVTEWGEAQYILMRRVNWL